MSRQSQGIPLCINGTDVTASALEFELMNGCTATAAEMAVLGAYTGSTTELNLIDGYSGTAVELEYLAATKFSDEVPGTGISAATPGVRCEHSIVKVGSLYRTEILVDITDLNEGGTTGDIIGEDVDTANKFDERHILSYINGRGFEEI